MSSSKELLTAAINSTKVSELKTNNVTNTHVGVILNRQRKKWQAYISVKGKDKHLGLHVRFEDAVRAREEAEIEYGYRIIK